MCRQVRMQTTSSFAHLARFICIYCSGCYLVQCPPYDLNVLCKASHPPTLISPPPPGFGIAFVMTPFRWLYLAQSCKEVIQHNGVPPEKYKVVYKRPTDLVLAEDVPVCCNLLVCDMLDDGKCGRINKMTCVSLLCCNALWCLVS